MKKFVLLTAAALLFTGISFANNGGDKGKGKKCAKGKSCCEKKSNGKSCGKSKDKKETTATVQPAAQQ
jgi:hypothetical protein